MAALLVTETRLVKFLQELLAKTLELPLLMRQDAAKA
jgi:hypothetical protein